MLLKGREVIGKKIISTQEGKEVGRVEDLVYDPNWFVVTGFVTKKAEKLSEMQMVGVQDVVRVGVDAVVIESERQVKSADNFLNQQSQFLQGDGRKFVSSRGKSLGRLQDISFNPITLRVERIMTANDGLSNRTFEVADIVELGDAVVRLETEDEEAAETAVRRQDEETLQKLRDSKQQRNGAKDEQNQQERGQKLRQKAQETKEQSQDTVEKMEKAVSGVIQGIRSNLGLGGEPGQEAIYRAKKDKKKAEQENQQEKAAKPRKRTNKQQDKDAEVENKAIHRANKKPKERQDQLSTNVKAGKGSEPTVVVEADSVTVYQSGKG